jgi:hypothetical protein
LEEGLCVTISTPKSTSAKPQARYFSWLKDILKYRSKKNSLLVAKNFY